MPYIQTRKCDGACCQESPRWPTADGSDCIYRDASGGDLATACKIMGGEEEAPATCPVLARRFGQTDQISGREAFEYSCQGWPHNMPGRDTGNCCWRWID